jgi:hypothetical protein
LFTYKLKNKKLCKLLAILSALGLLLGIGTANNTQGRINGSNHANANGIENANVKAGLIAPAPAPVSVGVG